MGGMGGSGGEGAGGLGTGDCPTGLGGPPLVRIVVPGGAYCLDATEVTNADYDLWLGNVPNPASQPAHCAANASFTPPGWPPDPTQVNRPVVKVDYCDAEAYCAAQSKHLCGAIGGGPLPSASAQDAIASEWLFVCTSGGAVAYPYGGAYDPAACNGADSPGPSQLLDVGASLACEGGVQGVLDLVGNVWEWDASCDAYAGPSDTCRVRGGAYDSAAQAMTCSSAATFPRSGSSFNVGFRCCADAAP
jgi:sulfatase modifying factor 1